MELDILSDKALLELSATYHNIALNNEVLQQQLTAIQNECQKRYDAQPTVFLARGQHSQTFNSLESAKAHIDNCYNDGRWKALSHQWIVVRDTHILLTVNRDKYDRHSFEEYGTVKPIPNPIRLGVFPPIQKKQVWELYPNISDSSKVVILDVDNDLMYATSDIHIVLHGGSPFVFPIYAYDLKAFIAHEPSK